MGEMKAGRELDCLIESLVFGTGTVEDLNQGGGPRMWCIKRHGSGPGSGYGVTVPAYSTRIEDAWRVVEKMESLGYWPYIKKPAASMGDLEHWQVSFYSKTAPHLGHCSAKHKDIANCICLAALAALHPPQ